LYIVIDAVSCLLLWAFSLPAKELATGILLINEVGSRTANDYFGGLISLILVKIRQMQPLRKQLVWAIFI